MQMEQVVLAKEENEVTFGVRTKRFSGPVQDRPRKPEPTSEHQPYLQE